MATNNFPNEGNGQPFNNVNNTTYASIMKEVVVSAKDLVQSEVQLVIAELKLISKNVAQHTTQGLIFGSLVLLSVLPFIAFLVIGLGELLDERYWLSSLIVSVVMAAIGGPLAYRAFKKIKDHDLHMPHTQSVINKDKATVQRAMYDIKTTVKGDTYESH